MPSARHCASPRYTGSVGLPAAKQPAMSVPPEIDESSTSRLMPSYTKSKLSGASTEPVERIVFSDERSCVRLGSRPDLRTASRYLAEVPNTVTRSRSARSQSTRSLGWNGEPSKSTSVAPDASPVASQFHIIQPQVVK